MTPAITTQQRLELFAVYLSLPDLHHIEFDEALADTALYICLKNTAEARKRAKLASRRAANDTPFELTP